MSRLIFLCVILLMFVASVSAADVAGKRTATFDTQIGVQNYTYEFKVDGEKLTGTAKSQFGQGPVEGTVRGDVITFTENLDFNGQQIPITYKGKIAGDEIKFTRQVGDFGNEELVAKRAK